MIYEIIMLILDALITGVFLWIGMKLVAMFMGMGKGAVYCAYWQLVVAAGASALVGLVPGIGWVLSIVVLFGLMMKFAEAGLLEIFSMVVISKIAAVLALLLLAPLLFDNG